MGKRGKQKQAVCAGSQNDDQEQALHSVLNDEVSGRGKSQRRGRTGGTQALSRKAGSFSADTVILPLLLKL